MSNPVLTVHVGKDQADIKVSGRATFECSENLKVFCTKILSQGGYNLTFDMSDCASMDSTFMGMLTKIALMSKKQKCRIILQNLSLDNSKNLFSLGLKALFEYSQTTKDNNDKKWAEVEKTAITLAQQRQNIIDAHQVLIDVHEENRAEFKDIVDFLNLEKEQEQQR